MKYPTDRGSSFTVKTLGALLLGLIMASSLQAQDGPEGDRKKIDTSYAYGLILGSNLKNEGIEFDVPALIQGLRDSFEGLNSRMNMEDATVLVQSLYEETMERQQEAAKQQAEENLVKEALFLENNGKRREVSTTASGLQYEVVQGGGKEKPGPQAVVQVHYEGTFTDGQVFDSSYQRGEAPEIPLDQVIPGWSEGVQLMGVGDIFIFYIPSRLAYGENGAMSIPPNTTVIFKVELLGILP